MEKRVPTNRFGRNTEEIKEANELRAKWGIKADMILAAALSDQMKEDKPEAYDPKAKISKNLKKIFKEEYKELSPGFSDHDSYYTYSDKTVAFATEPYDLNLKDLKEIVKFCEKHNLEVSITGRSPHFPGKTVRVLISDRPVAPYV